jgi:hypothetical protein
MAGETRPAQWLPDPTGKHEHRYWDGDRWTEHVADHGVTAVDAITEQPAPPIVTTTPSSASKSSDGLFAGMRRASEQRKRERAQQRYEADLAAWSRDDTELQSLIVRARHFDGLPDVDTPLNLKRDERVFYVLTGAGLMETRAGPRHWQGGYSGFSFRVTKGIRYHVGGTRGTSVQGDDETKLIDTGTATITNQRIVFQGEKQAREWAFAKLLGYQHDQHSPWTPIQVSNRQKVSGIRYDANTAQEFQFNLALALATFNGTRDAFVAALGAEFQQHQAQKPISQASAALPAADAATVAAAVPPSGGSGTGFIATYKRAPLWLRIGLPIVVLLIAIVAIAGGGSSGSDKSASTNHAAPIVTAATAPTTTSAPPTTAPPATAPPETAPPTSLPAAVPAPAPGPTCSPLSPAGNCYRRGEFCPAALHGQTITGSDGPITCELLNGYWRFE